MALTRVIKYEDIVGSIQTAQRQNKEDWKRGLMTLKEMQRRHKILANLIDMAQFQAIDVNIETEGEEK